MPSKASRSNGNGHCKVHPRTTTPTAASLTGDLFTLGFLRFSLSDLGNEKAKDTS